MPNRLPNMECKQCGHYNTLETAIHPDSETCLRGQTENLVTTEEVMRILNEHSPEMPLWKCLEMVQLAIQQNKEVISEVDRRRRSGR